jgi:hypothetical protein
MFQLELQITNSLVLCYFYAWLFFLHQPLFSAAILVIQNYSLIKLDLAHSGYKAPMFHKRF